MTNENATQHPRRRVAYVEMIEPSEGLGAVGDSRLLARWRRMSETLWEQAERFGSDNYRDAAAQLDGLIDDLASELEVAGEEPTKPASGVLCNALVADNGRTETVKERRWWEVKTWDSDAGCWRNAGNSPLREEIDRFIERAKRENFAVQVWEAVAVERTERVKQLETCSAY